MAMGMGLESMMGSAGSGAATGSALGPIGALAGAGIGGTASLIDSMQQRKAQKEAVAASRPKRRKLAQTAEAVDTAMERKLTAMSSLSQAAMDWAQLVR